ncbi:hypothetical protein BZA05DRAFT_30891 [Tricharina praecox]|uniref:uncharacterized protein n=1 Tax=Tricharina praecox TaxID=43433 RepID=UPI00221EE084|nr:uncharacterized protein BZA05DRAFT_30891 [Tricharina praecox]KAI5853486.1 hypothetical protein BZA05DRAFT_30891 [Tricharina praecox]
MPTEMRPGCLRRVPAAARVPLCQPANRNLLELPSSLLHTPPPPSSLLFKFFSANLRADAFESAILGRLDTYPLVFLFCITLILLDYWLPSLSHSDSVVSFRFDPPLFAKATLATCPHLLQLHLPPPRFLGSALFVVVRVDLCGQPSTTSNFRPP